jgi:hypothetical protein
VRAKRASKDANLQELVTILEARARARAPHDDGHCLVPLVLFATGPYLHRHVFNL